MKRLGLHTIIAGDIRFGPIPVENKQESTALSRFCLGVRASRMMIRQTSRVHQHNRSVCTSGKLAKFLALPSVCFDVSTAASSEKWLEHQNVSFQDVEQDCMDARVFHEAACRALTTRFAG